MTPTMKNARQVLFCRIVDALEAGGDLSDEVLEFVDASLFRPEPEALAVFISNDENSERDTLLDLIFYPDQVLQIELEPLLEAGRLAPDDEKRVLKRLLEADIDVPVRLPNGRELLRFRLPGFIKDRFLTRLNVARQLPPEVVAAIDDRVAAPLRPVVKVRLRNAGLRLDTGQTLFLARFFSRMDDAHPDYLACLDLVLTLLDEKKAAVEVYCLLVDYKRTCFRSLQQARRFEALLRRSNMETLMLQGIRPPQESPDELARRMDLIDRVCFGVYGRTEIMAPPMEEPLREVADLDTPAEAFHSLLR